MSGFGLPSWPAGDGGGFLVVKGLAMAVLLMVAAAPLGDMITVLGHHGSTATAFGVHGLTAALIAVTGLLILRETGKARKARQADAPAPAAQPA